MLDSETPGRIINCGQRHFIIFPLWILQAGDDERIVINKADACRQKKLKLLNFCADNPHGKNTGVNSCSMLNLN